MARQSAGVPPGEASPAEVPPWDEVEKSYELACELAGQNVELWWEEIRAVAQRLI